MYLLLTSLLLTWAAYPLLITVDMADEGLEVWWKEGEILIGSVESGRAIHPLNKSNGSQGTVPIPDLKDWTQLGASCELKPVVAPLQQMTPREVVHPDDDKKDSGDVRVTVDLDSKDPSALANVQLFHGDMLVAENAIPRPVNICSLHLVNADATEGNEIVVTWGLGKKIRGVTIFVIPEVVR